MVAVQIWAHGARMPSNLDLKTTQTNAFYLQAGISFGVSASAMLIGIYYLPAGGWIRAFLGLGLLYVVTSSFTLAKCVRDAHEASRVISRVDQARLERFLSEHDPFTTAAG
jgi:hypothetical protein